MRHPALKFLGAAIVLVGMLLYPAQSRAVISNEPLFLAGSTPPLVMLNISKDHQLSYKAYNDYSDLDGDGVAETTYKDSIDYYGYFDSKKCYTYSTGNNRFVPAAMATGTNNHYCTGQWSGNFLNWASMTRMDAMRKLLYGGRRANGSNPSDTSTLTVLERHYLPTDAHAFAKYYNGTDIANLTPFSGIATSPPVGTSTTSRTIGSGSRTFSTTLAASVGDQIKVFVTNNEVNQWMIGRVASTATNSITVEIPAGSFGGTGTSTNWSLRNLTRTGISLCNLTPGSTSGTGRYSHSNTNAPLLRVVKGNYALWGANERWQCYWSEEKSSQQSTGVSNGNAAYLSGINASAENPSQTSHGLGTGSGIGTGSGVGQYNVRVEACVSTLIGQERCKLYGTTYKPIGLLQNYGDSDKLYFGLMTGTFANNISGGVLRKNAQSFSNEINSSNGTFIAGANGIVDNLNNIRLYGYDYSDGAYINADNCTYQQTGLVLSGGAQAAGSPANEGNCSSWGNPMSEIYLESLRYLSGSGKAPNPDFASGAKDATLGLTVASWSDPLNNSNFCAPLNVLNFNASVSSFDGDQMAGVLGASSAQTLTTTLGALEGISGQSWFIGSNGTLTNNLCSSKAVSNFGDIYGICPEAPSQKGTYLMGGVAHYAKTNKIRTDLTVPSGAQYANSLTVSTYGIALASNVPKIEITLTNGQKVTILPAYRLDVSSTGAGPFGGGALVDFKIVSQTSNSGKFYVNWEDSEQGGDYDQDMWGIIEYSVNNTNNTITITTDAVAASTANGQGFGYIISGTNKDGSHFHSGIYNFDYTDSTGVTGCNNCVLGDAPTSVTYSVTGSGADLLKDPLWYTAKYGGFKDANGSKTPDVVNEWDSRINSTNLPGTDGIPDNFFYVTNPLNLERSLNAAFLNILTDSSASAAASNSSSLTSGSRFYQARLNSNTWSGQLLSYRLDATGSIVSAATAPTNWSGGTPFPEWDAGQKINAQSAASRVILTRGINGSGVRSGVDFQYTNLTSGVGGQKEALDRDTLSNVDNCGIERVAWVRGDRSNEGVGTFICATAPNKIIPQFRLRSVSVLGDIVNSNPVYVGAPNAGYSDIDHPGYSAFQTKFKDRKPVVYLGANDGMLHGIDASVTSTGVATASAGTEVIAFVPSAVYANLTNLTDPGYNTTALSHRYFVDSSPMVGDVCTSSCTSSSAVWKSLLVSGLGAGGKGFFALNVTNPDLTSANSTDAPLFNVTQAANLVLWEFDDGVDMGLTFNNSPPNLRNGQAKQIAKFANGRWGVVLGNGYESASGKAILYVLFVQGPTGGGGVWQGGGVDYVRIVADSVGPNNGLSTPMPFDSNGDGLVDTVYAGDIKGNMWKFDLSNPSPVNWTSATLLFTAMDAGGTRQPIINSPVVSGHPVTGAMVLFGTGKYLETSDATSTSTQTFYGIHDTGSSISGRSALISHTISLTSAGFRTVTQNCGTSPLPACPTSPQGWFTDLPTPGERTTGTTKLLSDVVFFNTFIPSISTCEFGGTGWLMALNYATGTMPQPGIFDTNGDGLIDYLDAPVAGLNVGAVLGGSTLVQASKPGGNGVAISPSLGGTFGAPPPPCSGPNCSCTGPNCPSPTTPPCQGTNCYKTPSDVGRVNWREILQ